MPEGPSFTQLLASGRQVAERTRYTIDDGWMQGRTSYGGLSTALALDTTERTLGELPPLRSATIAFIGPAGDEVSAAARVLRQGKTMSFVEATVEKDDQLATHCIFALGAARPSERSATYSPAPQLPPPAQCENFFGEFRGPNFTQHFDARLARGARPGAGTTQTELLMWVRHRDSAARGMKALLALADMPPPAVLPMLDSFVPISSATWQVNVIDPAADGEWWLLSTRCENIGDGYSSQNMTLWSESGALVLVGRQSVAVFDAPRG